MMDFGKSIVGGFTVKEKAEDVGLIDCPACLGKGDYVAVVPKKEETIFQTKECLQCVGTGKVVTCDTCKGKGSLYDESIWDVGGYVGCTDCDGEGYFPRLDSQGDF
jgi:DnaJ-class molecular chaperone